jgi:hypothetical protein
MKVKFKKMTTYSIPGNSHSFIMENNLETSQNEINFLGTMGIRYEKLKFQIGMNIYSFFQATYNLVFGHFDIINSGMIISKLECFKRIHHKQEFDLHQEFIDLIISINIMTYYQDKYQRIQVDTGEYIHEILLRKLGIPRRIL